MTSWDRCTLRTSGVRCGRVQGHPGEHRAPQWQRPPKPLRAPPKPTIAQRYGRQMSPAQERKQRYSRAKSKLTKGYEDRMYDEEQCPSRMPTGKGGGMVRCVDKAGHPGDHYNERYPKTHGYW